MVRRILIIMLICLLGLFDRNFAHSQRVVFGGAGLVTYRLDLSNISNIEDRADSIIKVRMLWKFRQNSSNNSELSFPLDGYTITRVKVVKVYKSEELTENQIISIIEPYYTSTDLFTGDMTIVPFDGNYKPLRRYNDYILFLNKYDNTGKYSDPGRYGCYRIVAGVYGKYRLSSKFNETGDISSFSLSDFDIHRDEHRPCYHYEKLFVEVMKKYK